MFSKESATKNSPAKKRLISQFARKMGLELAEADQFLHQMARAEAEPDCARRKDLQENVDLMLAVQFNARMRNIQDQEQFRKFRFLLNNGSVRAINLARLWMDRKISFDQMLVS